MSGHGSLKAMLNEQIEATPESESNNGKTLSREDHPSYHSRHSGVKFETIVWHQKIEHEASLRLQEAL
jgi:hypothetical protein